jgi:hypothetical protein
MYVPTLLLDKLLLVLIPIQNPQKDKILALTNKLDELSIQLANKEKGRPKPNNQCHNT